MNHIHFVDFLAWVPRWTWRDYNVVVVAEVVVLGWRCLWCVCIYTNIYLIFVSKSVSIMTHVCSYLQFYILHFSWIFNVCNKKKIPGACRFNCDAAGRTECFIPRLLTKDNNYTLHRRPACEECLVTLCSLWCSFSMVVEEVRLVWQA